MGINPGTTEGESLDLDKLRELISIFESSELCEIELEEEGRRIRLTKGQAPQAPAQSYIAAMPSVAAPISVAPIAPSHAPAVSVPQNVPAAPAVAEGEEDLITIDSPMVGVFYAAPSPNDPPFVSVGDTIEMDQTVCIVEAMKLMNEVTAKFRAVIVRVLAENAEPVEYGQPLFAVRPLDAA